MQQNSQWWEEPWGNYSGFTGSGGECDEEWVGGDLPDRWLRNRDLRAWEQDMTNGARVDEVCLKQRNAPFCSRRSPSGFWEMARILLLEVQSITMLPLTPLGRSRWRDSKQCLPLGRMGRMHGHFKAGQSRQRKGSLKEYHRFSFWWGGLGFNSYHLPALCTWEWCLNSLSLNFLICKMATLTPVPLGWWNPSWDDIRKALA